MTDKPTLEQWRAARDLPAFIDPNRMRSGAAGAASLQQALDEGFTDFVIVGLRGVQDPELYEAKVFSRPRPVGVLIHVLGTAQDYARLLATQSVN